MRGDWYKPVSYHILHFLSFKQASSTSAILTCQNLTVEIVDQLPAVFMNTKNGERCDTADHLLGKSQRSARTKESICNRWVIRRWTTENEIYWLQSIGCVEYYMLKMDRKTLQEFLGVSLFGIFMYFIAVGKF